MDDFKKMLLLVGVALLALTLVAGPVAAAEEPAGGEAPVEGEDGADAGEDEDEGGKIQLAETPRDQVGLILLGGLVVGGGLAAMNARRQLKGERPAATGEFRWR